MTELAMIFVGGVLGSSHCVGMCGGFALAIGAGAAGLRSNVARQLVYSAGRIFTYSTAGAAAGYAGLRLSHALPNLVHAQALLAIAAGGLLVVVGARSAGWLRPGLLRSIVARRREAQRPQRWASVVQPRFSAPPCLAPTMFASYLRAPGLRSMFLAGIFTGFLPCGLVYGFLALAGSTSSVAQGSLRMALFGLGTVPLLIVAGTGGSLLGVSARRKALRVAAVCVVATGVISILRGLGYLDWPGGAADACPFCE